MVDAVHDEHADERHQGQRADLLRKLPAPPEGKQGFVHASFGLQRAPRARPPHRAIVSVQSVGQIFADEMTQQFLPCDSGTSS